MHQCTRPIDIIMPVHNREKLVRHSIDSALRQTFRNWRLVIINDNCTDGSQDVIDQYMENDNRITCFRNDRYSHSCAGARLRGLDEISAKYIAFLDSDDTWPDYHLERLYDYLEAHTDIDWIFGDCQRLDENGNVVISSTFRELWTGMNCFHTQQRDDIYLLDSTELKNNTLRYDIHAGMQPSLIRRGVFEKVKFRDVFGCEDRLFAAEAIFSGIKLAFTNQIHLNYLVHTGNISLAVEQPTLDQLARVNLAEEKYLGVYLKKFLQLNDLQTSIIQKRYADHCAWGLAYNTYRAHGEVGEAVNWYLKAIQSSPSTIKYYKSLLSTLLFRKA